MVESGQAGRFQGLFGVEHPVVQGPFGGGLSSVALAAAVSEAGGLGSFGAHILAPEGIGELVGSLRAATGRPFNVNLWVPQDEPAIPDDLSAYVERLRPYYAETGVEPPAVLPPWFDYAAQVEALLAAAPPVISFVMGVPDGEILAEARRRGVLTIGTATTVAEAVALEEAGIDAVVASGSDAGGHRGAFLRPVEESLVGTFSLVPQVADAVRIPVIAAGGVADRRGVRAALALGADAVQIGTGFLATLESGASEVHKAALHADGHSTVLTRLFSGRLARAIPNRLTRELAAAEADVPPYPIQNALMLPIRRASAAHGSPDLVNLWSGQAAPLVPPKQSAAAYLRSLL